MQEDELVKWLIGGTGVSTSVVVWLLFQIIRLQRQFDALRIEFEYFVRESREWRVILGNKFEDFRGVRKHFSHRRGPILPSDDEEEQNPYDPRM